MTKADFEEKYGNFKLTFSKYYKYSFTYKGTTSDGVEIEAIFGGGSDDIYKTEVTNNGTEFVGNPIDYFWRYVHAKKGKDIVFEWSED